MRVSELRLELMKSSINQEAGAEIDEILQTRQCQEEGPEDVVGIRHPEDGPNGITHSCMKFGESMGSESLN